MPPAVSCLSFLEPIKNSGAKVFVLLIYIGVTNKLKNTDHCCFLYLYVSDKPKEVRCIEDTSL
jgi:hypothetical protein